MSKEQDRSVKEIVRDLCTFNPASSSESARLPHDFYMIFIGRLTTREHLQKLTRTVDSRDNSREHAEATKSSLTMMETEEIEFYLEYITLENNINSLSIDDAQAAALALSFYTGTKSEAVSRGTSLVARQANEQVIEAKTKDEMNETAVLLFYLVKALSYLRYY
ncbi:unnamed protein product [Rotaria sp. Silwood1]|nr:unnamed protein product [Rotaria sp. Silwood1]CAF5014089.1 unnamed protein product [Rotaria sp. Silwood1]